MGGDAEKLAADAHSPPRPPALVLLACGPGVFFSSLVAHLHVQLTGEAARRRDEQMFFQRSPRLNQPTPT